MLELIDICFNRDNKDILKNVNLKIDTNKFVAITGPNGSGKSTLAKIIMGIEKQDEGKILFDGEDISKLSKIIKKQTKGNIYSMVCFDKEIELKKIIKEESHD